MTAPLDRHEALDRFRSTPVTFLVEALVLEDAGPCPRTDVVIGATIGLFLAEVGVMLTTAAASTAAVVAYLFVRLPELAWPLAPLLHRGAAHLAANVAVLAVAAPVEHHLGRGEFAVLLVGAGFLPVYAHGGVLLALGPRPHAAVYGASAFAFGLLGCGLVVLGGRRRLTPREWVIVAAAVLAVGTVVVDAALAIVDPLSLNVGHLGGLAVGAGVGYRKRRARPGPRSF